MATPTAEELEAMDGLHRACKRVLEAEAEFWPDYPEALSEPLDELQDTLTKLLAPEGEAQDWQAQNALWLAAEAVLTELDQGGAPEVAEERVEALRATLEATSLSVNVGVTKKERR